MGLTRGELLESTPLSGGNADYVEAVYERFLLDPASVDKQWRDYFSKLPRSSAPEASHRAIQDAIAERARHLRQGVATVAAPASADAGAKQGAVSRLIQIFANRGHLVADLDPLGLMRRERPRVLTLEYFGLSDADLDTQFFTGSRVEKVPQRATLRQILNDLNRAYTGTIGAEFAHVSHTEERLWLQDQFQVGRLNYVFGAEERKNILWQLTAAEGLERYLHTKYVGQKRFSLEGGDALIPLLDDAIQTGGSLGAEEFVIGMAHRGRLNVLVNVLGKAPSDLFSEFEGKYDLAHLKGSGDVKYHKGFSADLRTAGGNVHVTLAFNPSHLEVVNAVVEGSVRARQERREDALGERVVPILIHGDAAFAGQGVVMETLQLSQARGYYTGGTLHVVINNQVGFTTSKPEDARSTMYCSDIAKMLEAPIFHVNGDDPEAVVFVTRLAMQYRQRFHKDVVIDLVCYRRLGHNEADEPAATQPLMYSVIRKHPTARKLYADRLQTEGVIPGGEGDALVEKYRAGLDEGRPQARASLGMIGNKYTVDWSPYMEVDWARRVRTGVDGKRLKTLGERITAVPAGFALHSRVQQVVANRVKMVAGEQLLDWGCAETLAYASLLEDGYAVRISGQDCGRGTFFHRHAVWHDQQTGAAHVALQHIADRQPRFQVIDSVLSEEAVMGFEYGYATTDPGVLVIWEGQFGDFANGAQVIIDQFISSGESKWGRYCGLTLLLPHGYEGQGPEHSSARLERYLQLCAESNMSVCVPSTPAQMFHLLRRQMLRSFRKPLIVMTPKSLLRHELAVSSLAELQDGPFKLAIDEVDELDAAKVRRVVFSSGKVYYDLLKARRAAKKDDVALVRLEQLYPFPVAEYEAIIKKYGNAKEIVWCQEEPQNQGAWYQIRHQLDRPLAGRELLYAGRAPAAAPATGIAKVHDAEQAALVSAALNSSSKEESARETRRLAADVAKSADDTRSVASGRRKR
ncbi:MAG: 2-oxoglutarate dehydrogenase E1 component [Steroidobacteraceae bacterium]|jgi:2-oxoglutarate dehydrogenase E1 component|nr:2-oxoglutarate dehydrogenase E1 component [Gammaproteobacteria bacterium]